MQKVDLIQLTAVGVALATYSAPKVTWGKRTDWEFYRCTELSIEKATGGILIECRFADDDPESEVRRLLYAGPYLVEAQ